MFGLFENKQGKMLIQETLRTINKAEENLTVKKKQIISKKIIYQIFECIKEIEGTPAPSADLDKIIKKQVYNATKNRQKVTTVNEETPQWIEAALIESFVIANAGSYGKKASLEVGQIVMQWCRENMSEKDLDAFEKKYS